MQSIIEFLQFNNDFSTSSNKVTYGVSRGLYIFNSNKVIWAFYIFLAVLGRLRGRLVSSICFSPADKNRRANSIPVQPWSYV